MENSLDETIEFGKYRGATLEKLLNDTNYTRWIVENCKPSKQISKKLLETIRYHHDKRLSNNSENKTPITGVNLTARIKSLLENRPYDSIIKHNIPNINAEFEETEKLVSTEFCLFVRGLHAICPSDAGCFIDYLMRRFITEQLQIEFQDARALLTNCRAPCAPCVIEEEEEEAHFPQPFAEAYEKVSNASNKTKDVINEIFVISLGHGFSFGRYDPDSWRTQYEYVVKNFVEDFMDDLQKVFTLTKGTQYALNPVIGIHGSIRADADLIIDDNLIDFKVTKSNDNKYEFFQLLGYASLAAMYNYDINMIHIINFYTNTLRSINITDWVHDQRIGFLDYLCIDTSIKPKEKLKTTTYLSQDVAHTS